MEQNKELMDKIISLTKRRGFIFPGSEIYGGLQNSWDYGPLGVELKNNIKQAWWKRFVQRRADMVGIDAALFMNKRVWEASGHVGGFVDPLVEDKKTHVRYRADHLLEDNGIEVKGLSLAQMGLLIASHGIKSPAGNELTEPRTFNMMFKTHIGVVEDEAGVVYMRPETAQAMFVDFLNVLQTSRKKPPFGIAQIGKAFRNEITPGNFIFRMREFEQMEIEYFIPEPKTEAEWQKYFEEWRVEMKAWMKQLGLKDEHIHELEVEKAELAHYSKRTIDFEYDFPFGKKELYGLAYRTNFDLTSHAKASGETIDYKDPTTGVGYVPHVIEPSMGVDRSLLAMLVESYCEEEVPTGAEGSELVPSGVEGQSRREEGKTAEGPEHVPSGVEGQSRRETRIVLKFPRWAAPVKVAVLPLMKKEPLGPKAHEVAQMLREHFAVDYDETQSIGKRYRRQDEIGTPFCVTIDFDTIEKGTVTVRDRDTMQQERVAIADLKQYIENGIK